jgi:hypothetical protein
VEGITLEPDFYVTVEGLKTNEEAQSIGNIVLEVTKTLSERFSLDISKLKRVLVSTDFGSALQRVVSEYNHTTPSSFTQSKQATAIGQVVTRLGSDGTNEEYTLVLSINFFIELFDDKGNLFVNKSTISSIVHRLHHEIVHVHEKNTLTCLQKYFRVNEYGDVLLVSATRVWSEYLANFISSKTASNEIVDDFLKNLEVVINDVPKEVDDYVLSFQKKQIMLDEMYVEVKKRVRLIINSFGYAIGYIHGLNINIDEYYPELAVSISNSKLNQPLNNLTHSLTQLLEKYNNNEIKDFDDFTNIATSIEGVFDAFGITIEGDSWSEGDMLNVYVD